MSKLVGWKFPISVDQDTGRIKTISDNENIKQGVRIILRTEKGERKMLSEFGSQLKSAMFRSVDFMLLRAMYDDVSESIREWEEHITDLDINIEPSRENNSKVITKIKYSTDISPEINIEENEFTLNDIESSSFIED